MKSKYKDNRWGTSIKKMPWDDKKEKSFVEKLISSTMKEWYDAKHRIASNEEIEFINSITPLACHHCMSKAFIKYGKLENGIIRYKCKECNKTFNNLTNTIFDSHKIPISEWFEYLLHLFEFHSIKSSSRDNKNANSTGKYWLIKIFEVLKNYQKKIVLSGDVVYDETFFNVVKSKKILKDGKGYRWNGNSICIAVGYDGFRTLILSQNTSKPSSKSTFETMWKHIEPYSKFIHDGDASHIKLIKFLDLKDRFCKGSYAKLLPDDQNPLTPINNIHSFIKKFMRNHEGFSTENIQDWMNLISFILNEPQNRYEKLKLFIKMAISSPKRVKYRDVMGKKTSSGAE